MVENSSIVQKVPWSEKDSECDIDIPWSEKGSECDIDIPWSEKDSESDIDILQILGSGHTGNVLGPGTNVKNIGFLETKILGLRNAAGGIQISDSS